MALFKYIVLSVCLCGIHLNGFAQSTREAILEDIARTGGVYYAYPVKEAIATPREGTSSWSFDRFGRRCSQKNGVGVGRCRGTWGRFDPFGCEATPGDSRKNVSELSRGIQGISFSVCTLYRGVAMCIEYGCLL